MESRSLVSVDPLLQVLAGFGGATTLALREIRPSHLADSGIGIQLVDQVTRTQRNAPLLAVALIKGRHDGYLRRRAALFEFLDKLCDPFRGWILPAEKSADAIRQLTGDPDGGFHTHNA